MKRAEKKYFVVFSRIAVVLKAYRFIRAIFRTKQQKILNNLETAKTQAALLQLAAFVTFVISKHEDDQKIDLQEKIQIAMQLFTLSDVVLSLGTTWAEIKDLYPIEAQKLAAEFETKFALKNKKTERFIELCVNAALANTALIVEGKAMLSE